MQNFSIQRTSIPNRNGIAPLEFVMALPVLLLLMVGITWLGFTVIGQTECLVEARNKAWKRRFENASDKPLYFPLLIGLYDEKSDYVTEKASQKVDVSPIFSKVPGPQAGHMILAGSWDRLAMPFDEPPDFKLMAKAAGIGLFGNVLDVGASLGDPLGLLQEVGDFTSAGNKTENDNKTEAGNVGKGQGSGSGTDSGGGVPNPRPPNAGETKTKAEQEQKKKELKEKRDALGGMIILTFNGEEVVPVSGKLRETKNELDVLDAKLFAKEAAVKTEPDPDKKKQLQVELDRLKRDVKLKEITYDRLVSEFRFVDAELKALG